MADVADESGYHAWSSAMPRVPLFGLSAFLACGCVVPPSMCASEIECGSRASCVAGRCVAYGATPVIDSARRLLFSPVDMAYVRGAAEARDAVTATLGATRDPGAVLLLRFSASLAPDANVLEAYLLLERATDFDADPTPVALRAARVIDPWDSRSLSSAREPRVQEVGAPVTRVFPSGGPLVRLDVRELVQRWRRRTGDDFGVAVTAQAASATGMGFALSPAAGQGVGPRLELYVK